MKRLLVILGWATLIIGGGGGLHAYVWYRLVLAPGAEGFWLWLGTLSILTFGLAFPLSYAVALKRGAFLPYAAQVVMHCWYGFLFYLALSFALLDLARALGLGMSDQHVAWIGAASALLLAVAAIVQARRGPVVERVLVQLRGDAARLAGLRLVQISDLHVGSTLPAGYLGRVVDRIEGLGADLVVITGDLLEDAVKVVGSELLALKRLSPALGAFFVTGNHDYYAGVGPLLEALETLGVRALRNERVRLVYGAESFDLAGVDDGTGQFIDGHGPDFERALGGRDATLPLILLAHEPRAIHRAAPFAPDLQLSGHTHAGQIWPFGWLVRLMEPYIEGLHHHNERTQIYVSRGTGYWGPPMRLPKRSEITLFHFQGNAA